MQEYTLEQFGAQIAALRNVFDKVQVIDPRASVLLDPATMEPAGTADPVPELDERGRAAKPLMSGPFGFALYQAVVAGGRPCVLQLTYTMPDGPSVNDREANALQRMLKQYREDLRRDYVTGVYNRSFLDTEYRYYVAEQARSGKPVCMVMARVNEFGDLIRNEGATAADCCLNAAAGILQLAVSQDESENAVVRLEDGVFLIVAVGSTADRMEGILRKAIDGGRKCFSLSLSRRGEFTVTLGSADWAEAGNWELMMALAEQRLGNH
ncbi:MAG: GGDEF domain-containing protein [Gemmiger sp.]|uniref:GGDEF domain-containing protein n=1 Tax=Gemmiger sp. TaxID=2049027 RepID=UPI002E77BD9E|nr:GGDEF domain-containing protein [Gemmiger sp.]MEE0799806.1 GGDEF domain-containing protein [Gemmiger sp.]